MLSVYFQLTTILHRSLALEVLHVCVYSTCKTRETLHVDIVHDELEMMNCLELSRILHYPNPMGAAINHLGSTSSCTITEVKQR